MADDVRGIDWFLGWAVDNRYKVTLLLGQSSLSGQIRQLGSETLILRDGEDDWIVRRSMISAVKTKEARDRPTRPIV